MNYTIKDIAVMAFVAGLLTGLLVAFASCSPTPDAASYHITTGAQQQ